MVSLIFFNFNFLFLTFTNGKFGLFIITINFYLLFHYLFYFIFTSYLLYITTIHYSFIYLFYFLPWKLDLSQNVIPNPILRFDALW